MADKLLFNQAQLVQAALSADANGDGNITVWEVDAFATSVKYSPSTVREAALRLLDNAVANSSGFGNFPGPFSKGDVAKGVLEAFRQMDYTKNGVVSQSEYDFSQTFGQRNVLFGHPLSDYTYPQYMKDNAAKYR